MSRVTAYYHIVFATKAREKTIPLETKEYLYRFIWRELRKLNCTLIRIGGIENHVHIMVDIHPSVSLSRVIQDIKSYSSSWLQKLDQFPHFKGWAKGYYACSVRPDMKDTIVDYIKNQEIHHSVTEFDVELKKLHEIAGMDYDNRDLR